MVKRLKKRNKIETLIESQKKAEEKRQEDETWRQKVDQTGRDIFKGPFRENKNP